MLRWVVLGGANAHLPASTAALTQRCLQRTTAANSSANACCTAELYLVPAAFLDSLDWPNDPRLRIIEQHCFCRISVPCQAEQDGVRARVAPHLALLSVDYPTTSANRRGCERMLSSLIRRHIGLAKSCLVPYRSGAASSSYSRTISNTAHTPAVATHGCNELAELAEEEEYEENDAIVGTESGGEFFPSNPATDESALETLLSRGADSESSGEAETTSPANEASLAGRRREAPSETSLSRYTIIESEAALANSLSLSVDYLAERLIRGSTFVHCCGIASVELAQHPSPVAQSCSSSSSISPNQSSTSASTSSTSSATSSAYETGTVEDVLDFGTQLEASSEMTIDVYTPRSALAACSKDNSETISALCLVCNCVGVEVLSEQLILFARLSPSTEEVACFCNILDYCWSFTACVCSPVLRHCSPRSTRAVGLDNDFRLTASAASRGVALLELDTQSAPLLKSESPEDTDMMQTAAAACSRFVSRRRWLPAVDGDASKRCWRYICSSLAAIYTIDGIEPESVNQAELPHFFSLYCSDAVGMPPQAAPCLQIRLACVNVFASVTAAISGTELHCSCSGDNTDFANVTNAASNLSECQCVVAVVCRSDGYREARSVGNCRLRRMALPSAWPDDCNYNQGRSDCCSRHSLSLCAHCTESRSVSAAAPCSLSYNRLAEMATFF